MHFGVEAAPSPSILEPNSHVRLGVSLEKFAFSLFATNYEGSHTARVIFPTEFNLLYRNGGLRVDYNAPFKNALFKDKLLSRIYIQAALGDVVWNVQENGEDRFREVVWNVQPGIELNYQVLDLLRVSLSMGWRLHSGLDMPSLRASDFSGAIITFGVAVGVFRKLKVSDDK